MRCVGAIGVAFVVAACGAVHDGSDAAPPDSSTQQDVSLDVVETSVALDAASDVVDAASESSIDAGACAAYESMGPYGCNKLLPPATKVPLTCAAAQAATGGAIADGYYELTSYAIDTTTFDASCPAGGTHTGIVMFCSGTVLWLDIDQNSSGFDLTGTYVTSGNTITISPLSQCSGNKDTYEYTATPTTFEIRGGSVTLVATYTLK